MPFSEVTNFSIFCFFSLEPLHFLSISHMAKDVPGDVITGVTGHEKVKT